MRAHVSKMAAKIAFRRLFGARNLFAIQRKIPDHVVSLTMRTFCTTSARLYPMVPIVIEQTVSFLFEFDDIILELF